MRGAQYLKDLRQAKKKNISGKPRKGAWLQMDV